MIRRPAVKKPRFLRFRGEATAWTEPEELTVSECADRYRVLSGKSEKRGPWETSYNPVSRAYQDAFGCDCVQEIWLMKPAQSGGTDGLLNMLLYAILQDPGPALLVEPNESLADKISTDRIDDMIESSDKVKNLIRSNREETGKKKKTFAAMTIYFGWAGSAISLASQACRYVFLDEIDKYEEWTGKEASPVDLGKERTATFRYTKKIVFTSTPTIEEAYLAKGERECEARFRYVIDCPHCGHEQQLRLDGLKWPEDSTPKEAEESTFYECAECKGEIREDRRMELVRRGRWRDTISGLDFEECIKKVKPRTVGFQFNRLYTPWFSFGMVAAEFLRAKDDPKHFQNFRNSWMAEPWAQKAEAKTELELMHRIVDIPARICPDDTLAVTLGVDPGQGGFWFLALAWLQGNVRHVVDYGFISFVGTDLEAQIRIFRELVFSTRYRNVAGNRDFLVWRAGMDTGGGKDEADTTMTTRAYTIIRKASDGRRLLGTKGTGRDSAEKMHLKQIDKMPGKKGTIIPGGLNIWMLNVDALKDSLSYYLGLPVGSFGGVQFNRDIKSDLVNHLLAEEKRRRRDGKWEWHVVSAKNHLLDCAVIALGMGDKECWGGVEALKRPQCLPVEIVAEKESAPPEAGREDQAEAPPEKKRISNTSQHRRQGWFSRR
jgi:phage terminase large subunit GpA-like protein